MALQMACTLITGIAEHLSLAHVVSVQQLVDVAPVHQKFDCIVRNDEIGTLSI